MIATVLCVLLVHRSLPATSVTVSSVMRQTADSRGLGVCLGGPFMNESATAMKRDFSMLQAAGTTWIRMDFDWSRIEPTQGSYDWSVTDNVVNLARQNGMKVLGVIDYTPSWAQQRPSGNSHVPPAHISDFARFASVAAAHYTKLGVNTFEIWNEPNLAQFWSPAPDAWNYAALLKASVSAIRRVVPHAYILSGGLAPAVDAADGSSVSPPTFLARLYRVGAAQQVDAISVHPYSYPALAAEPGTESWNSFLRIALLRGVMAAAGDPSKSIWLTEYGAPTGKAAQSVSEKRQSDIIQSGLQQWVGQPNMGPMFIYNGRDAVNDPSDPEANFGLLRNDFTPKEAYQGVKSFMGR